MPWEYSGHLHGSPASNCTIVRNHPTACISDALSFFFNLDLIADALSYVIPYSGVYGREDHIRLVSKIISSGCTKIYRTFFVAKHSCPSADHWIHVEEGCDVAVGKLRAAWMGKNVILDALDAGQRRCQCDQLLGSNHVNPFLIYQAAGNQRYSTPPSYSPSSLVD